MSLPQGKREFIRKLVAGLDNLMEITQIANQIGISPRNEIEEFIKKADILYEAKNKDRK